MAEAEQTEVTRRLLAAAEREARTLHHKHVGTEHLLLGVMSLEDGAGARALAAVGMTLSGARADVMRIVGLPDEPSPPRLPMTPPAQDALSGALRHAIEFGRTTVGPEHVLLALLRERHSIAARVVRDAGVDRDRLRAEIRAASGDAPSSDAPAPPIPDAGAAAGAKVGAYALLGLLAAGGPAADLLREHGIDEAAASALLERSG